MVDDPGVILPEELEWRRGRAVADMRLR